MAECGVRIVRDPDLGARIGRQAAEVVRHKFCRDTIVPKYEEVYRSVLED
jgi:hypothetical protein